MIIDTHSHLHGPQFAADLEEVVSRAGASNVGLITLVGVDVEDCHRALDTARKENDTTTDFFRVVAGVHPNHANTWSLQTENELRENLLNDPLVVAVGEMGLDYHYDFVPREKQREAFLGQLALARESSKPIVIHCREAYDDLLTILEAELPGGHTLTDGVPPAGVLHCFFGTLDHARRAAALGFLIGVGGSCTFKKAEELHEVVRSIPLQQIVLETDAPYMAPVPYRGKRNESGYLPLVAARIAELRQISPDTVVSATELAARKLFRLPIQADTANTSS